MFGSVQYKGKFYNSYINEWEFHVKATLLVKPGKFSSFFFFFAWHHKIPGLSDEMLDISCWNDVCLLLEIWQLGTLSTRCIFWDDPCDFSQSLTKTGTGLGEYEPYQTEITSLLLETGNPYHSAFLSLPCIMSAAQPPPHAAWATWLPPACLPNTPCSHPPSSAWIPCPSSGYTQLKPCLPQVDPYNLHKPLPPAKL